MAAINCPSSIKNEIVTNFGIKPANGGIPTKDTKFKTNKIVINLCDEYIYFKSDISSINKERFTWKANNKENKLKVKMKYIIKKRRAVCIPTIASDCRGRSNNPIFAIPEKAVINKILDSNNAATPPIKIDIILTKSKIRGKHSYRDSKRKMIRK